MLEQIDTVAFSKGIGEESSKPIESLKNKIPDFVSGIKETWSDVKTIKIENSMMQMELQSGDNSDILNNTELPCNGDIKVYDKDADNYTTYKTDDNGRVIEVYRPEIDFKDEERNSYQQVKAKECKDGVPTDDGGHLVANEFGGISEQINYEPMNPEVNRHGEWRLMEKDIGKALGNGQKVTNYKVECIYDEDSKRPSGFEASYEVDGSPISVYIDNPKEMKNA